MTNFDILFEDKDFIIVNKKNYDPVQADQTQDTPLVDQVQKVINERPGKNKIKIGSPHRLDRPTSGIVIFTKNNQALALMNEMFRTKQIQKTYWTIVDQAPPENKGRLIHYLTVNKKIHKSYAHDIPTGDAKEAILDYELIGKTDRYYLLQIKLSTGRQHQIRAQLSKIGLHIKGDCKYGFKRANKNRMIHLHSRYVEFIQPLNHQLIQITAEPPSDPLWEVFLAQEEVWLKNKGK